VGGILGGVAGLGLLQDLGKLLVYTPERLSEPIGSERPPLRRGRDLGPIDRDAAKLRELVADGKRHDLLQDLLEVAAELAAEAADGSVVNARLAGQPHEVEVMLQPPRDLAGRAHADAGRPQAVSAVDQ